MSGFDWRPATCYNSDSKKAAGYPCAAQPPAGRPAEGGPGGATRSITMLIYQQGFEEMKFSYAIAESLLIALALMALSMIQIKVSQRKQVY